MSCVCTKTKELLAASSEVQTMFGAADADAAEALIFCDRIKVSENGKMERPLILVRPLEATHGRNTITRGTVDVRIEDNAKSYTDMDDFRDRVQTIAKETEIASYDGLGRLIVSPRGIDVGTVNEANVQEKAGQGDYYTCTLTIRYG